MRYARRAHVAAVGLGLLSLVGQPRASETQTAPEILTNESVVEMMVGKVPRGLILAKIQSTPSAFDVSAEGLSRLYSDKVPLDVIRLMVRSSAGKPSTETLSNASIVSMISSGLPRALIHDKIQNTNKSFGVSARGLVALDGQKTPADTLEIMIGASPNTEREPLTNADVVLMVSSGLPRSVVLKTIQSSRNAFDLTSSGLVGLNQDKIPQSIVKMMMTAATTPPPTSAPLLTAAPPAAGPEPTPAPSAQTAPVSAPSRSGGPTAPTASLASDAGTSVAEPSGGGATQERELGIYLEQGDRVVPLQPALFSSVNTGSVMKAAWTWGAAKGSQKVVVRSNKAGLRSSNRQPTFLFYLDKSSMNPMSNPNEFVLARMTTKGKERELTVGKGAALGIGGSTEIKSDTMEATQVVPLGGGVFRVTPATPLKAGEYCFFYPGGTGRLFDFGVD